MSNVGLYPADPTTPTGQFRLNSGDWNGTPADPATDPQTATYAYWGDDEIAAFLTSAGGSVTRALGHAFKQLARILVMAGKSIKTDDLALNSTSQGKDLDSIAEGYFAEAAAEDQRTNADDIFNIIPGKQKYYGYGFLNPLRRF